MGFVWGGFYTFPNGDTSITSMSLETRGIVAILHKIKTKAERQNTSQESLYLTQTWVSEKGLQFWFILLDSEH